MRIRLAVLLTCLGLPCAAQTPPSATAAPRKLTVQPKLPGAPAYEIGSNRDGRDATQDPRSEGRALWQLFAF